MWNFYLIDKNTALTLTQILKLEAAIGYGMLSVKRGIYRMYKNFAETGTEPDPEWEQMCSMGLATRHRAFGSRYVYRATQQGIDIVGMITGAKIRMADNIFTGKELEEDGDDLQGLC